MPFIIPNQTSTSLLRPVPAQSGWTRPADWITIVDTPGQVQFLMSDATTPNTAINTSFTRGASGNIYIDWGDGIIDTITATTSTSTNHTYTSGGTPSTLGYNMWKIRVYGDSGTTLTNTSIVWNTNQTTGFIASPSGILEAVYGDGTQTGGFQFLFASQSSPRPSFNYLTYVKLPSVFSGGIGNHFFGTFTSCFNLRKVVMPISAVNNRHYGSCFQSCYNLSEPIILPQDNIGLTTLSSAFLDCRSLTSITLPPTLNSNLSMNSTFANCFSLTQIQIPPTPLCLDYPSMLSGCRNLLSFEFKAFPTAAGTINMSSMFVSCSSLEYIKLPPTAPTNQVNLSNAFQACVGLKNCVLPSNLNVISFSSTFLGCSSLSSVILPTSLSGLLSFAAAFDGCQNLQQITLPTSVGAATISINTMFRNCASLTEITIPSTYNLGDCSTAFNNCFNLRKITLPNNAQNGITNMSSMCNGCSNLQSIVMPTSMNSLTTLAQTFQTCFNLQSIVFPSSLNACSTMVSTFITCANLNNVVMPTSMTSLTNLFATFNTCYTLEQITLPASVSPSMTLFQPFNSCISLNNAVLPTTQMTGITSINAAFTTCWSLTGITNQDKIGNPSTGATIYIDGSNNIDTFLVPSLDFSCKFSAFAYAGRAGILTKLTSLRLRNNGAGQYGGASPQINIIYNSLGQAALVQLFNDLPTITSKTISIVGNPGAALLTPAERAIATGKGWTIVG
jgi:hypothetical protein